MKSGPQARFVDQFKQLRTLAGEPTLADLEKQNSALLKEQTVSDLLAGQWLRAPRWERIAAFVTACVRIGKTAKLTMPPEEVLLEQWRHQHAALAVILGQTRPRGQNTRADGTAAAPVQSVTITGSVHHPPTPNCCRTASAAAVAASTARVRRPRRQLGRPRPPHTLCPRLLVGWTTRCRDDGHLLASAWERREDNQRALNHAHRALDLFTRHSMAMIICWFTGGPGQGKSTLSLRLAADIATAWTNPVDQELAPLDEPVVPLRLTAASLPPGPTCRFRRRSRGASVRSTGRCSVAKSHQSSWPTGWAHVAGCF